MTQPQTLEERVAALEAELAKMRPRTEVDSPRDMSTAPVIDVRKRMEAQDDAGVRER